MLESSRNLKDRNHRIIASVTLHYKMAANDHLIRKEHS